MDPNYFSTHVENRTIKYPNGRLVWTPIHRIEVRLANPFGHRDVFRHTADLDGDSRAPTQLIERMRTERVHERTLTEMIANGDWERQRSSLWVDSSHMGRVGSGRYSYSVVASKRTEIERWSKSLCENYHPMGYGTIVHKIQAKVDGTFTCSATRAGSCD
jgi:hypothetical protein